MALKNWCWICIKDRLLYDKFPASCWKECKSWKNIFTNPSELVGKLWWLGFWNGIVDDSYSKPSEFRRQLYDNMDSKVKIVSSITILILFWSLFDHLWLKDQKSQLKKSKKLIFIKSWFISKIWSNFITFDVFLISFDQFQTFRLNPETIKPILLLKF